MDQQNQQPVQEQPAANVQQDVSQVKIGRVGIPKIVIDHERKVLDRPIMGRVGIEEEIMPERLKDEDRTFNERIIPRKVVVVPDELSLERGEVDNKPDRREKEIARPLLPPKFQD